MHFLDIFDIVKLDIGFNLVKKALAACLCTSISFYSILAQACVEIRILYKKVTYVLRHYDLFNLFWLSFFPFPFLFATVIDLLMGLLAIKKLLRKHHLNGQFLPWSRHMQWQEILLGVFHSTF